MNLINNYIQTDMFSTITALFNLAKQRVKLLIILAFSLGAVPLQASFPVVNDSVTAPTPMGEPTEEMDRGWFSTSLYAEFGIPQINHDFAPLVYDNTFSYGAGLTFNFRFVNWLGLQVGTGVSYQNLNMGLNDYNDQYMTVDNEGDAYQKIISAQNVKEEQTWLWLNVPIALTYYHTFGEIELYGFGGLEMRHALIADYNQSGTFTHQGYYEQWNILFDNLPEVGFYSDRPMEVEDQLEPDLLMVPFLGLGMLAPGQKGRFYLEGRYYLNSQDPFASKKQASLFPGPEDNQSVFNFNNGSVMNYKDVSFGGFKIIVGVNF